MADLKAAGSDKGNIRQMLGKGGTVVAWKPYTWLESAPQLKSASALEKHLLLRLLQL